MSEAFRRERQLHIMRRRAREMEMEYVRITRKAYYNKTYGTMKQPPKIKMPNVSEEDLECVN